MAPVDPIHTLQASIAPCVLISGAGLLLLSMTNRLSRPIDRIRLLCAQLKLHPGRDVQDTHKQIKIMYKRCQYLRSAIVYIIWCIVFVSLIVLLLFLMAIFQWQAAALITGFFILSLFSLVASLVFFLRDVLAGLESLKIEINTSAVIIS